MANEVKHVFERLVVNHGILMVESAFTLRRQETIGEKQPTEPLQERKFAMALDREYQALPEPCQLLEQAKFDHELGELVQFISSALHNNESFFSLRRPGGTSPIYETFRRMIHDMELRHPGIEKRSYDVDRRQDSLLYLLSEDRRHGRVGMSSVNDIGSKIINGASALPSHIQGAQGIPLRYSSAREVQEMASSLESITTDDLRKVYDPVHMEKQGVYKFSADWAEQEWESISRTFLGLKAFYIEVAASQEGILIVTD